MFSEVDECNFLILVVDLRYSSELFVETEVELILRLAGFPIEAAVPDVVFEFGDGVVCPVLQRIADFVVCFLPVWIAVDFPVFVERYSVSVGSVVGVELVPGDVDWNPVSSCRVRVSVEQ